MRKKHTGKNTNRNHARELLHPATVAKTAEASAASHTIKMNTGGVGRTEYGRKQYTSAAPMTMTPTMPTRFELPVRELSISEVLH